MGRKKNLVGNLVSFFDKHTDPEKQEKLKATREDMEEKKKRLLKMVHSEEEKDESKRESITDLIDEFHKQYETLYSHYDHLTGELKDKVHKHHHERGSSSSDSDSDSNKSSKKGTKNGKLEHEIRKATDELQQDLEAAKVEVTILENKLGAVSKEKDTLESAYDAVVSQLETVEKTVEDLKEETENLKSENSNLLSEKEDLTSKLEGSIEVEVDLKKLIEELTREKDDLAIEKDDAIKRVEEGSQIVDNLKFEIERLQGEKSAENKELQERVSALEHEINTVQDQNKEMKLDLEKKADEIAEYFIQIENLHEKLLGSDKLLKEHFDDKENLAAKLKDFEIELGAVQTIKSELEAHTDKTKQEFSESLMLLEDENTELKQKEENLLIALKDMEDALNQKREQCEQLEGHLQESKVDLEAVQSQIEKLTRDLSTTIDSKDESVAELEMTIEVLKREVEIAEDEANGAMEKTRTIEVQLRLTNQKLRITEQLLTEKEEEFKISENRFQEECKFLEDKISKLSAVIADNNVAYRGMIMNISENVNVSVDGMESVTKKFEGEYANFSNKISNISDEIHILKSNAAEKNAEKEKFEKELQTSSQERQNEHEKQLAALSEQITFVADEKREAIRQLCLWSDNLQTRYDELKNMVLKPRSQRR